MYHYSYYLFYCYPLCLSDINLFNPKRMIESIFSPKLRSTIYALGRVNMFLINEEIKTDSLSDIVIYQGKKSNKCWKEIQTNDFTAYYDNVPLEKKRFYDDILSSITPINNSK